MIWTLGNGEERNRRDPDTFKIPSRELRENLQAGDHAKLLFMFGGSKKIGCTGEKMWVEIIQVGDNAYEGELRNEPSVIKGLKHGDKVAFMPMHIVSVIEKGEQYGNQEEGSEEEVSHEDAEEDAEEEGEEEGEKDVSSADLVDLS